MNEQLKIIISAEIDKLKQNLDNAKNQLKGFKEQVKEAKKNVDEDFKAAGEGIKTGLKAGAVAIGAAGAAILALGASTAEYRNEQAKLVSAFEAAGSSANTAKDTYNDLYRVLGDSGQATEAAAHLAKLTTEEKGLSEWTNICQGVYATFGDSLPIEGLTEAANETAKVGTVTGGLADALNWAGISEDAFNEKLAKCNTEAEREKLIRETLNGVYADAAKTYEKNNESILKQNEAQAKLQENTAKLGEAVAPINTALTSMANDVLAVLMPYIQSFAEKHLPTIEKVLGQVGEKLKTALEFLIEHKTVLAVLAGAISGIVIAIGLYNAVAAVRAAMAAAEVATVWALVQAQLAHAAAVITAIAPYLLIVAAIAAVIAIIVLCVKHWDTIKEAVKKAIDIIVEKVKAGIDWVIGFFEKIIGWVKDNWQGLLLLILNPFAGAFKLIYDNCEGFRNTIDKLLQNIKQFFSNLGSGIKNIFVNIGSWFSEKFTAAANGVKNAFSSITSFFSGIWNSIKSIFSKVGTAIASGITGAVKGAVNAVLGTAAKIINNFISAINTAISIINLIPNVNIKKLNKLNVPQLAKGGIVDSATLAVVGEQGKEAVVPLENNLEWLDKLANKLAARQGNNKPIYLMVDKRVLGQVSAEGINDITSLTGVIPLNVFA